MKTVRYPNISFDAYYFTSVFSGYISFLGPPWVTLGPMVMVPFHSSIWSPARGPETSLLMMLLHSYVNENSELSLV